MQIPISKAVAELWRNNASDYDGETWEHDTDSTPEQRAQHEAEYVRPGETATAGVVDLTPYAFAELHDIVDHELQIDGPAPRGLKQDLHRMELAAGWLRPFVPGGVVHSGGRSRPAVPYCRIDGKDYDWGSRY